VCSAQQLGLKVGLVVLDFDASYYKGHLTLLEIVTCLGSYYLHSRTKLFQGHLPRIQLLASIP
jgi:hypothetical protein